MGLDIVCPSKLAGTVRGLTVAEAELLTDKKLIHEGLVPDKVLATAWERTTDMGPYSFQDKVDWEQALVCDRFVSLMSVRIATYGPEYDFKVGCQGCKGNIDWYVNLFDLERKELPKASIEKFRSGEPLEIDLDGDKVLFHLMDGRAERKNQKALRGSKNRIITALAQRIDEVVGHKNKMLWIRNLPLKKAVDLINKFDEHDGGVETQIDVICPDCGMVQGVALPFDRPAFWLPVTRENIL